MMKPLPEGPICAQCGNPNAAILRRCSRCMLVHYCSTEHQTQHRPHHKYACNSIGRLTADLTYDDGDDDDDDDPDNNSEDYFARNEKRLRLAQTIAHANLGSRAAVDVELRLRMTVLHTTRMDLLGICHAIPGPLVRLGLDQECYDFITRRSKVGAGSKPWLLDKHMWGPLKNFNPFEPCPFLHPPHTERSLSHMATMMLLKMRILKDIRNLRWATRVCSVHLPVEIIQQVRAHVLTSNAVTSRCNSPMLESEAQLDALSQTLESQIEGLYQAVNNANPFYWGMLVDSTPEIVKTKAVQCSPGDRLEAQAMLRHTWYAWAETEGAIASIKERLDWSAAHPSQATTVTQTLPQHPHPRQKASS